MSSEDQDRAFVNTLVNIEKSMARIRKDLNQVTWLLLLVWLSIIGLTVVVASTAHA